MAEDLSTHKIGLWVANDESLYRLARECVSWNDFEEAFKDVCLENSTFGVQILMDLLNGVDWQDIWEAQQDE